MAEIQEQTLTRELKAIISEIVEIEEDKITPEARFVEDLGAESIQSVELVAAFEEEFDIEMDEEDALAVKNVGNAVEFIKKMV